MPTRHVEDAGAQIAQDRDAFERVDLAVQVAHAKAVLQQEIGQVFGHLLGQRRHQHAFVTGRALHDLFHEIVHLIAGRTHLDLGIDQAGRADDHLHDLRAQLALVGSRRRRNIDRLIDVLVELFEGERPVVEGAGQPEAVLDQDLLARAIAAVHAVHLRQRDVRLVDEEQPILREEVDQTRRRRAGLAPGEVARVVLDAVAIADLAQHVEVVARAHLQPLRFEQFAVPPEVGQTLLQLVFDRNDRAPQLLVGRDEMLGGEDRKLGLLFDVLAGEQVDHVDRLDLVAEEFDAVDQLLFDADKLERIAAHPERTAHQVDVVATVLHVDELAQQHVAVDRLADAHAHRHLHVVRGRTQTEDARDRGHDQRVAPGQQRLRGRMPQAFDLVVDRTVFLDVGVGRGRCTLRADSNRSTRRSTRPRCSGRTRGTRRRAAPPASCCGRAPASAFRPARWCAP